MTHKRDSRVLVVARDSLLSALVGALVETAGLTAAFARVGESVEDAIRRSRPLKLLLVEVSDEHAFSDVFLARARRHQLTVVRFGSRADLAARRPDGDELASFALPDESEALLEALRQNGSARKSRTAQRRSGAGTGTFTFADAAGIRWSVYDRRTMERRRAVDRHFVSATGEARHCLLTAVEAAHTSSDALREQLARSVPE